MYSLLLRSQLLHETSRNLIYKELPSVNKHSGSLKAIVSI